ncbi:hypothetical protein LINGRAHAP2_LOCUS32042 [Linum grandiflorum]
MSSTGEGSSAASWAVITSDPKQNLCFVAESLTSVVDGVLHVPKAVIDVGIKRLESAVVAQFVGKPPPIRVVNLLVNRLWGWGEPVIVSQISLGFFMIELPSVATGDWVLARS